MNVKQVYSEWYDTVSDNERAKCDIFNIDDVEFIINDLYLLN